MRRDLHPMGRKDWIVLAAAAAVAVWLWLRAPSLVERYHREGEIADPWPGVGG